jgi:hypothetical protein
VVSIAYDGSVTRERRTYSAFTSEGGNPRLVMQQAWLRASSDHAQHALEYGSTGLTANCIQAGVTDTLSSKVYSVLKNRFAAV